MDGFERRKEQSKEDIRRAAEELFSTLSTDKVSINDIARKAGVSQATIYNNFGSKDALVHDYHKGILRSVAGRFRDILVWKKSYIEKFQGLLQSMIDFTDRYKIEIQDSGARGGSAFRAADATSVPLVMEIEKSFREFIREGQAQGSVPPGLSEEAVVDYIRFFQQGVAANPEVRDRMNRNAKYSSDLLSLFIYGVCGQSGETAVNPGLAYSGSR